MINAHLLCTLICPNLCGSFHGMSFKEHSSLIGILLIHSYGKGVCPNKVLRIYYLGPMIC